MSNADHPPTLVDLAARMGEQSIGYMESALAVKETLAALRALPRYELDIYAVAFSPHRKGDWIKVSDLLTLLGDKQ